MISCESTWCSRPGQSPASCSFRSLRFDRGLIINPSAAARVSSRPAIESLNEIPRVSVLFSSMLQPPATSRNDRIVPASHDGESARPSASSSISNELFRFRVPHCSHRIPSIESKVLQLAGNVVKTTRIVSSNHPQVLVRRLEGCRRDLHI